MVIVATYRGTSRPINKSQGYRVTRKGYLIVWGAKHKTLATFAPGAWEVAQCLDQQEQ